MNSFLNKVRKLVQFRSQVTSVAEILNRLKISQSQREIQKVEKALRELGWTCVDSITNAWLPPGVTPKVEVLPKEEKEQESESENYVLPAHLQDWQKSGVDRNLTCLNIISVSGDNAYEKLLYGLDGSARRNDGRLRDYYLNKYKHLDYGGWWCSGIDVLTGKDSDWGCFKPDRPRTPHQKNKPQKYEQPEGVPSEIFALRVTDEVWDKISDRYGVLRSGNSFWDWVRANPQLPIVITEGAKKAGALLCQGHVAIALPGINNGCRNNGITSELIPQLHHFCQRWREFVIAFDQDKKYKTRKNVTSAILTMGKLFKAETCQVSVLEWRPEKGKGIDDAIVKEGSEFLEGLLENRIGLEDYEQARKERAPRLDAAELIEFCEGEFEDRLSYDELRGEVLLDKKVFDLANTTKVWFVRTFGYQCGKEDLLDTLLFLAQEKRFNPVHQYLNSIRSSQPVSIDNLATRYFGTTNPLYDEMIRKWLIGAVARALNPGCQMDYALILVGKQGQLKSSFFRALGGEFFDDSIKDIPTDDAHLTLNSCWIAELAEFDRITQKKEASDIKHFITQRKPRFRKKYDREISEHPRRTVICGSVNKNPQFLLDETGNRRFWIIPVPDSVLQIDIERLNAERDGIWATALAALLAGEIPMLDREYELLSEENNKRFEASDEWESDIAAYLEGRELVSVSEILEMAFNLETAKHDRKVQMRVTRILSKLGWEKLGMRLHRGKRQQVWCDVLQTSNMAFSDNFSRSSEKVERLRLESAYQSEQEIKPSQPQNERLRLDEQEEFGVFSAVDFSSSKSQPLSTFKKKVERVKEETESELQDLLSTSQPFSKIQKKEGKTPGLPIIHDTTDSKDEIEDAKGCQNSEKVVTSSPSLVKGDFVEFEGEVWEVIKPGGTYAQIKRGDEKKIIAVWQLQKVEEG
jgi:predicted P-loop ATPase